MTVKWVNYLRPFWRIISNRISCSRAFRRNAAIDELRRSSGGGDELWTVGVTATEEFGDDCNVGDETLIGVIGADVEDLFESVGEIGGETESAELTGIDDKYSDGDFVDNGGSVGGRWAAEIFANRVWNDALAGE